MKVEKIKENGKVYYVVNGKRLSEDEASAIADAIVNEYYDDYKNWMIENGICERW